MMITVRPQARGTMARIWLDELPPWGFPAAGRIERTYVAPEPGTVVRHEAAIELLRIPGPRIVYGGLAMRFTPGMDDHLRVSIPNTDDTGETWVGDYLSEVLRGQLNQPYIALKSEYVGGVLEGIEAGHAALRLGAGILDFPGATHNEIGSSHNMFRTMTQILLYVLTHADVASLNDEEWWALINEYDLGYGIAHQESNGSSGQ